VKILIRGLEAGSAYLAYLLSKSGYRVTIQTKVEDDVYLYDFLPTEPFIKIKYLKEVSLVNIVEEANPADYDVVVDSCDIFGLSDLLKSAAIVEGDPWLTATLSTYRRIGERVERRKLDYEFYEGGLFNICGESTDALSNCTYRPLRTLERIFLAADVFEEIALGKRPPSRIKMQYYVARDYAYFAFGCRPAGKRSRANLGGVQLSLYAEGGIPNYVVVKVPRELAPWVLALYNLLRRDPYSFLYDFGFAELRGPFNIAAVSILAKFLRRSSTH